MDLPHPHKRASELIGRDSELAALAGVCGEVRAGRGGTVLVSGETGLGVTRLSREALDRGGMTVLSGRALEEATPAYGPIVTVLRECLRRVPELARRDGPVARHLSALLPEAGTVPVDIETETIVETIAYALSVTASEHPVAVFLDDLQWADNATLEVIPRLDERMQNRLVLIVAAFRSDEITRGHPVRRLRHTLRRAGRLTEIALRPLDAESSRALVFDILGEEPAPSLARLIHDRTQGVPLYVEELTNAVRQGGLLRSGPRGVETSPGENIPVPEGVRDAVVVRLEAVSPEARRFLEAAAVVGERFDADLVGRIAGDESGFDELCRRGLIVEDGSGRASFRHTIVRDAVRDEIGWSRRRALHREAATALEHTGASPDVIAEHWLFARENGRARAALLAAAERSCRVHAYHDAVRSANRALELWPDDEDENGRVAALRRLAHCAQLSGRLNDAARALREVIATTGDGGDTGGSAEAFRSLATVYQLQGSFDRTVESRRRSAELFARAGKAGEAAVEWLALAGRYTAALCYDAALDAARTAARLARAEQRWDTTARALGLEGNVMAMRGDTAAGRKRVHEGLSLALEHNAVEAASDVYRRLGSVHEFDSDYRGAREAYFAAVDYCRAQGVDGAALTCLGCVSYIVYRTGDWKRTLEVCREILTQDDQPGSRAIADGVAGLVRAHRGQTRTARRLLQTAMAFSTRFGITVMELAGLYSLAVTEQNDGNTDEAAACYRRLIDRWEQTPERHDVIPWLCWAATFFAENGRVREATICTEKLASIASETGNPEALAGLAHALGETALLRDKPDEAQRQFAQAVDVFGRLEVPLELSLAQYRAGVAARRAGNGKLAAQQLNGAYRLARKLGARPLADRIARALETAGERAEEGRHPDATRTASRGGLTRRQSEVARLIAEGLTNKEIAHRLYLSPRTVDMHVGNILDRLDCRSRTEAARRASELGLLD